MSNIQICFVSGKIKSKLGPLDFCCFIEIDKEITNTVTLFYDTVNTEIERYLNEQEARFYSYNI